MKDELFFGLFRGFSGGFRRFNRFRWFGGLFRRGGFVGFGGSVGGLGRFGRLGRIGLFRRSFGIFRGGRFLFGGLDRRFGLVRVDVDIAVVRRIHLHALESGRASLLTLFEHVPQAHRR